jgi:hypothetical protein
LPDVPSSCLKLLLDANKIIFCRRSSDEFFLKGKQKCFAHEKTGISLISVVFPKDAASSIESPNPSYREGKTEKRHFE